MRWTTALLLGAGGRLNPSPIPHPPPLAPEGALAHPFSMRVVQKFGGTSVADAERIRHVAGQVAGRVG